MVNNNKQEGTVFMSMVMGFKWNERKWKHFRWQKYKEQITRVEDNCYKQSGEMWLQCYFSEVFSLCILLNSVKLMLPTMFAFTFLFQTAIPSHCKAI